MLSNCSSGDNSWESLGQQENQTNPKENQPWIFTGWTDAEAEAPKLWPPDAKSRLTGKDIDTGKDWGQEEKEVTEDKMVDLHQPHNGYEFEQTPGDSERQWSLVCWSSRSHTRLSDWSISTNCWYPIIRRKEKVSVNTTSCFSLPQYQVCI